MFKFDTTLNRLRSIGTWEAVSYILLLGVAVPMKRVFHMEAGDMAVSVVGMVHGILFMAYVGLAILGEADYKWPRKTTVWLFIASLLPFGPFVADAKLLQKVEANQKAGS